MIYHQLGDFEQAKGYQQLALDIYLEKLGAKHVNVATSYSNFALIYKDLGDLEQARQYQYLAEAIRADKHGHNKTPNKVRIANRRKKLYYGNVFLLERFYAGFKVYCFGTVSLKFV